MTNGYYIYEPERLDLLAKHSQLHSLLVELESLLIQKAYQELRLSPSDVVIEVISVKYVGSYPAIGIKGDNSILISTIVSFIDNLLSAEILDLFVRSLVATVVSKRH